MYVYWKTIFSTLLVLKLGLIELTNGTAKEFVRTTEHIGVETKYGECLCPLSCSVHCNLVYVLVTKMTGGVRAPPTLASLG